MRKRSDGREVHGARLAAERSRTGCALVLVTVIGSAGLSACSTAQGSTTALSRAAAGFDTAVSAGDSTSVCAMLTADVVQSLEQDGASCPAAVSQLDLSDPGVPTSAQVWGRDGLVRFSDPGNDVFWTAVDGAWRVTAAGCTRNADAPADCELEAG